MPWAGWQLPFLFFTPIALRLFPPKPGAPPLCVPYIPLDEWPSSSSVRTAEPCRQSGPPLRPHCQGQMLPRLRRWGALERPSLYISPTMLLVPAPWCPRHAHLLTSARNHAAHQHRGPSASCCSGWATLSSLFQRSHLAGAVLRPHPTPGVSLLRFTRRSGASCAAPTRRPWRTKARPWFCGRFPPYSAVLSSPAPLSSLLITASVRHLLRAAQLSVLYLPGMWVRQSPGRAVGGGRGLSRLSF